jgi:hypothetical protein
MQHNQNNMGQALPFRQFAGSILAKSVGSGDCCWLFRHAI